MVKKYELTNETKVIDGTMVYRIRALCNFGDVKSGDLGGFIEKEENLSHDGNCWVYDDAAVYEYAKVSGNAKIARYAEVSCYAEVGDDCVVTDEARMFGYTRIRNNVCLQECAIIGDDVEICGRVTIGGKMILRGVKRIQNKWVRDIDPELQDERAGIIKGNVVMYEDEMWRQLSLLEFLELGLLDFLKLHKSWIIQRGKVLLLWIVLSIVISILFYKSCISIG